MKAGVFLCAGGLTPEKPETTDMRDLLKPKEAALLLGVDPDTLRVWNKAGKIKAQLTPGGQARYLASDVKRLARVK